MDIEIRSHYYNYYNVKSRYNPETKQTAGWAKIYEQVTDRVEDNNYNRDSEQYQAFIKLENIYYDQGVKNRAMYGTYQELQSALAQKYLSNNSSYAAKYSYAERSCMYQNELSMSAFGYCTNLSDPLLGGPVHAETDAERQNYNRNMVNTQIKNVLTNGGIDFSTFSRYNIKFTIEPYDYRLTILGLDDNEEMKNRAEDLLNSNGNSKELFFHILNSLRNNSSNISDDVMTKYMVAKELQYNAGLDFRDFVQTKDGFVNSKGENILELYKAGLQNTTNVPLMFKGTAFNYFSSLISKLSDKNINDIADLELTVGFDGQLRDEKNENIMVSKYDYSV